MKFLEEDLIAFKVAANSPHEAIRKAGDLLVNQGYVEPQYIDAMIRSYDQNGPYIVIAPEIAIPHARPEDGVREASVSMVQLVEPVVFGSKANDPVSLVFALGASNSEKHLELLKNLMNLLGNKETIDQLKKASSYEQIKTYLNGGAQ